MKVESIMALRRRAVTNYPGHKYNQRAWIEAVLRLRQHSPSKWILDVPCKRIAQ